ncbi:MAG: transposase, partial [candidate division NC10 bacterium]|nr:transposase [candidate division NC10 bacterium]
MAYVIREQRIRQRLNWFRKAQEFRSVTDACVFFGISRKTYYKWWRRYAASRWDRLSLADRSRRPHRHPRQVGTRMARRLRRWRRRTGYGARRLAWHLRRKGVPHVPSVYGIHRVLQRAGLLTRHRSRPKHRQRYVMPRPGDCVQVDIKYVPYTVERRQVFQYTALDDCTRLRVVRFFPELTNSTGLTFLPALRQSFPFRIRQVQTDNDATFTNLYTGAPKTATDRPVRLHPFTLPCEAPALRHRCIRPRSPHLNGKVERSHRIDGEEFYRDWRCRSFA